MICYLPWLILILFPFFDVYYFVRGAFVIIYAFWRRQKNILDECVLPGICLTTDLDFVLHMNNSRYLRECDFARFDFWIRTSWWKKVRSMGGSMTNGGNNIRYRKSIELFDRYDIHTKISYWDEKSFYFEQTFVRCSDKFICAIVIVKQTLIGITPEQLIAEIDSNIVKPEPLPDILKWIESNQLSSERLRKSL
ncbi:protein THEM6 [Patella vulgata]|uniref:protein THEM6 n=1 Tax=Patella vulgata TaxID=6465 RepID=UPI0021801FA3|nr:protein THEM6 [Patella vulgata]